MTLKIYLTHHNGDRPYRVQFDTEKREIEVFREGDNCLIDVYTPERIFIGKSPKNSMTEFSGGYGRSFDGNTFLLHLAGNTYLYIGNCIYIFQSESRIIEYFSPVGNNDVPYPYAKDEYENIYLLVEKVMIKWNKLIKDFDDPYTYYYKASLITEDCGFYPSEKPVYESFDNIHKFLIGSDQYTFRYKPNYDYDRLVSISEDEKKLFVIKKDGAKVELIREDYISLMTRFGEIAGFSLIKEIKNID